MDVIARIVDLVRERVPKLKPRDVELLDKDLRVEFGGISFTYFRKRPPTYRERIRAEYDGTLASATRLAKECNVSLRTIYRIARSR